MKYGGYDIGYINSDCFWGKSPGSLLLKLEKHTNDFYGKSVLDLGCGEGKNSYYLADKGCIVKAFDISNHAINNGKNIFGENRNVILEQCDVLNISIKKNMFDIIIAYGLFHCFESYEEIEKLINSCIEGLKFNGFFIVCAFNSRKQDLSAHKNFHPLLLDHHQYLNFFNSLEILYQSDEDLYETHPHNNIPHMHSLTRLIIRKT